MASTSTLADDNPSPAPPAAQWLHEISRRYQHILDQSVPFILRRWIGLGAVVSLYAIRVYFVQGFYIVSYALGIYVLNLLIAFLSPQVDPEIGDGGGALPVRESDEFRPFVRRLPEFKFWYSLTKAFCIAFVLTFNAVFDVRVFWRYSYFIGLSYLR